MDIAGGIRMVTENDLKLVSYLRKNSREKLTRISKETSIPISTLFDMMKCLENGVIVKSTILVDFSKLGYDTRAHVFLKVDRGCKGRLIKHLTYNKNVNSVFRVNNEYDFCIETVHRSIKELDEFLHKLEDEFMVRDCKIFYLVDEVKREGFVV